MMSLSARRFRRLTVLLITAASWVGGCVYPAWAQSQSVQSAQVIEMISRVRSTSQAKAPTLDAIAMGQRLLVEQRYAEALELFEALREKQPREPLVLYGGALAAFNLGRSERADPLVRLATEIYFERVQSGVKPVAPELRLRAADAFVLLALVLGARGDDAQALKTVQQAVALAPEHFDAQFTLGTTLYSWSNFPAAAMAFQAALRIKPDDAKTLFLLATTLEGAGASEAALNAYREVARRHPQTAEGHLGLGVLLTKRGGAEAAKGIEELRTAVRIDPNLYEAQVTLGRALLIQKLTAESIPHLQRAAELAPRNPEPHYHLALAYRRLGQNDKAVEQMEIVKRVDEARRGEGAARNDPAKPD